MDNGTLFYIFGGLLAASAVIVSILGLKIEKFPGRVGPIVALWFIALIGCATTFAVLHAQDEEQHKAAELEHANEEVEQEQEEALESQ